MAVFPEQMDRLNLDDTTGSLQKIENYIRYMTERMEFSSSNSSRLFAETGTTNASVIKALLTVSDRVSILEASVNIIANNTTALANSVSKFQGSVDDLNESVVAVQGRISALQNTVTALQQTVTSEISALKARVDKLEGGTEA